MYIQTAIRSSTIFGRGLFATEAVEKGKIICLFSLHAHVIDETLFLNAIANNEHEIIRTATRLAGKYYTHGNIDEPYTFINHSFSPNLLCHVGVVVARRAIAVDEELSLDYRTLVDDTDLGVYRDAASGREIRGFSARETMLQTARDLIAVVETVADWQG